ncbi:MAG: 16S rRNA (guanine(966)-N(2))-methyltransferase RsmD [Limnohabitans sp.]
MSNGEVRIIGGQWKRSKLPVGNLPGLRPTPDRVRETLFNWLGQDLTGWYCTDPYAGTGALGFEAASRGAASVVLADASSDCVAALLKAKDRLGAAQLRIQRSDGLAVLRQLPVASQDVVFLDPPYDYPYHELALKLALQSLKPEGMVYLEADQAWRDDVLQHHGWTLWRHLKAGSVHAHLLRAGA